MKTTSKPAIEFASPGLLRIFASMVYDSLLLAAISIAYGAFVVAIRVAIMGQPEAGHRIQWGVAVGTLVTLGWLFSLMVFYVYFWQKFGQTLGMKTWRIQLVDAQTYQLVSFSQAITRSLAAMLSLACLGIGYWLSLAHPQGRLLHDVISGTQLILLKKTK